MQQKATNIYLNYLKSELSSSGSWQRVVSEVLFNISEVRAASNVAYIRKREEKASSETLKPTNQIKRRHDPEDHNLNIHHHDDLKPRIRRGP
jgi:predicted fused transcriptional regulator/phosphomethylpyrimidine kinase